MISSDEDQEVVIGEREDLGITVKIKTGTVPKGKKLTMTIEAVVKAKTEPPKVEDKVNPVHHDSVSSIYAVQKNDVTLLEKILVTIAHSAVIESEEDKQNMEFLLFRLSNSDKGPSDSTLKFVGIRNGEFLDNLDGDQIGILELENRDLITKLFVEVTRKILLIESPSLSPSPTTTLDDKVPRKSMKRKFLSLCYYNTLNNRHLIIQISHC